MNKKEFNKLKVKWYKKLEKTGFQDIEKNEHALKQPAAKPFNKKTGLVRTGRWTAQRDYFLMTEQFLNIHNFETNLQKIIWEYHSNGLGVRAIADVLNKTKVTKTNRQTIWLTIRDLRKIMWMVVRLEEADTIEQ